MPAGFCRWLKALRKAPEVLALIGVIITGAATYHFWTSYPPDTVNLTAEHISSLSMTGGASAEVGGYAGRILLHGATGQFDAVVPIAVADCDHVATILNTKCESGTMKLGSLTAQWTKPQSFSVPKVGADQVGLSSVARESGGGLRLTAATGQDPRVCMLMDRGPATLTLESSAAAVTVPGDPTLIHMCDGVVIHVQSAYPSGTAVLVLQDLSDATSTLSGKKMNLTATSETLTLVSISSEKDFTHPIEIDSDNSFQVSTQGIPPDVALPGDVLVPRASHVEEAHAEWLANETVRNPRSSWILTAIPALLGVVPLALTRLCRRRSIQPTLSAKASSTA